MQSDASIPTTISGPIAYTSEVFAADRHLRDDIGIPEDVLMESAARGIVDAIDLLDPGVSRHAYFLAGTGNNGADAIAAARIAWSRGREVTTLIALPESELGTAARRQLVRNETLGLGAVTFAGEEISARHGRPFIVDGLLGAGSTGPPRPPYDTILATLASFDATRIAIDIPTGLHPDTGHASQNTFRADITVTMGAIKPGLIFGEGPRFSGRIIRESLGLPVSVYAGGLGAHVLDPDHRGGIAELSPTDHKYDRGFVRIVAGSFDMPGAAVLAATAALRAGAGLVEICNSASALRRIAPLSPPEVLFRSVESDSAIEHARPADCTVIGPGLGQNRESTRIARSILGSSKRLVIDAEGLDLIRTDAEQSGGTVPEGIDVVVTPHAGEMARICNVPVDDITSDPLNHAERFFRETGYSIVLKGPASVVRTEGGLFVSLGGHPGMATAGSGDVLAGILGGILAGSARHGAPSFASGISTAVALHAAAGRLAAERNGERSMTAGSIIESIRDAIETRDNDRR